MIWIIKYFCAGTKEKKKAQKHNPADGIIRGEKNELNSSPTSSYKSDFILLKLLYETTYRKTRKPLTLRLQAPWKGAEFTLNT